MIFDSSLGLSLGSAGFESLMERLIKAVGTNCNGGNSMLASTGVQVMLHTGLKADRIVKMLNTPANKYRICPICGTLHFKLPAIIADPFVCPCGKTINK